MTRSRDEILADIAGLSLDEIAGQIHDLEQKASRRARNSRTHTSGFSMSSLYRVPKVHDTLGQFAFEDEDHPDIQYAIAHAIAGYRFEVNSRPVSGTLQSCDRENLIAVLDEVIERMFPENIPRGFWNATAVLYKPGHRGKESLLDEIGDLSLRLKKLRTLLSSIELPTNSQTNPGKGERDRLVMALADIFDRYTQSAYEATEDAHENDDDSLSAWEMSLARRNDRAEFVGQILAHMEIKVSDLPRLIQTLRKNLPME